MPTVIRHHAIGKAMAKCSADEIIAEQQKAFGDAALSRAQVYRLIKGVKTGADLSDKRGQHDHKSRRTPELIAAVQASLEVDRRAGIVELAEEHDCGYGTMHDILHLDLNLVKKSARWVPKLLSPEQMQKRVDCATDFLKLIGKGGPRSKLHRIITMDETLISLFTPETKNQSKQWLPVGEPAPTKAKVQASRNKRMALAFFDSSGLIYTRIADQHEKINSAYIIETLDRFLDHLRRKRPDLWSSGNWLFHWDNCPVHKSKSVADFLAEKQFKIVPHPPYSPDLAPADFFLFPKVKSALAGKTLTADGVKTAWEGVTRSITAADYADAFQKWIHRFQKCIDVDGNFVEK